MGVLFAETGGEAKNRPFLDALLGVARGRIDWDRRQALEFPASYQALAKQLQKSDPNFTKINKDSQLQKIGRMAKRFFLNQDEAGILWVEKRTIYNPATRCNEPTRYRLRILEYALEAFYRAKSQPEKYKSDRPGSSFERAAREVAAELSKNAAPKRKQQRRPRRQSTIKNMLQQTLGTMRSMRRTLSSRDMILLGSQKSYLILLSRP